MYFLPGIERQIIAHLPPSLEFRQGECIGLPFVGVVLAVHCINMEHIIWLLTR